MTIRKPLYTFSLSKDLLRKHTASANSKILPRVSKHDGDDHAPVYIIHKHFLGCSWLKLWILKELIFSNLGHPVSHHHPSDLSVTLSPSLYFMVKHISKSSIQSAICFLSSTTIGSKNQVQNGVWYNPPRSEWFLASNHEVGTSHKKEKKKEKKESR